MRGLPLWVDDSSSLHINTLCARIRKMRRKHGIKLFVIDYLQLIVGEGKTEAEIIKNNMFKLRDLGFAGPVHARDLWTHKDVGVLNGSYTVTPPKGGVVMLRLWK